MPKVPSMSSKALVKLLEKGRAVFVRQGSTDHAIYSRIIEGKRYSAPVQMGKRSLDPVCGIRHRKLFCFSFTPTPSTFMVRAAHFEDSPKMLKCL